MVAQLQPTANRSFWDILRFTQYVNFTVDLPPEECFKRLMGLAQPGQGLFNRTRITTHPGAMGTRSYGFQVYVAHPGEYAGYNTSVKFTGRVWRINEPGRSLIQGKLAVSNLNLFTAIIWTPLMAVAIIHPNLMLTPFFGLIALLFIWHVRSDYRKLRTLIYTALQPS